MGHARPFPAVSALGAILLFVFCALPLTAQQAADPAGAWSGDIDAGGHMLAFSINLVRSDTAWSGTVSVPEQGAKDLALSEISVSADSVVFALDVMGHPTFRGAFRDANTLAGELSQGGNVTTFTLRRGGAAPAGEKASPAAPAPADASKPATASKPADASKPAAAEAAH